MRQSYYSEHIQVARIGAVMSMERFGLNLRVRFGLNLWMAGKIWRKNIEANRQAELCNSK